MAEVECRHGVLSQKLVLASFNDDQAVAEHVPQELTQM
jgi:hypothetical protein